LKFSPLKNNHTINVAIEPKKVKIDRVLSNPCLQAYYYYYYLQ
jgi:hypothetical protein